MKKRSREGKPKRPSKKQKRIHQYNSDSDDEKKKGPDFAAVNLLDSDGDDDLINAQAEEGESPASEDGSDTPKEKQHSRKQKTKKLPVADDQEEDDEESESEGSSLSDYGDGDDDGVGKKTKSKRNDPSAFATSLSKILSTKISTSKRADPVLIRSAAAHEASKAAVDTILESKARKQMREQKRRAMEKGRVKSVLIATNTDLTGEPETSTAEILQTERRLRKVAQRGVVKLFNAVRAAQVKAGEAEKTARRDGVIGIGNREEKVNELSKNGFLELIASGGGKLKKGPLEEA